MKKKTKIKKSNNRKLKIGFGMLKGIGKFSKEDELNSKL